MVSFKGVINGTVTSVVYNLPFKILYMKVANLNAGNTVVNITIEDGYNSVYIAPKDLTLSSGDFIQDSTGQVMDAGNQIKISTSGSVSYYFTIENIQPD